MKRGLASWCLWASAILGASMSTAPSPAHAAEPLSVGVLRVEGDLHATELLIQALRGYPSLTVVSIAEPEKLLGSAVAQRLSACADDACRVRETRALGTQRLVMGSVTPAGANTRLRLRLVDSSTTAATVLARVSEAINGVGQGPMRTAVVAAAQELFLDLASEAKGNVTIASNVAGALVALDGKNMGPVPVGPVPLSAGVHKLEVTAAGHRSYTVDVIIELGQNRLITAELSKNRSLVPLYLAGGAAVASGIAIGLGASAQSTANAWEAACDARRCDAGFTRERYDSDVSSVNLRRGFANGMYITAGALAVGAIIYYFLDPGSDEVSE